MFTVSKGLKCVVLSGLILLLPFIMGGGRGFDMYKLLPTLWNGTVTVYQWYVWICFYPVILLYHTFKDYFIEALNYYLGIVVTLGFLLLNKLTLTYMYGKEEPVENIKDMLTRVFDHHMVEGLPNSGIDFSKKETHLNHAILTCSVFLASTIVYWKLVRYAGILQLWYINETALRFGFGGYLGLSLATLSSAGRFEDIPAITSGRIQNQNSICSLKPPTIKKQKIFVLFEIDAVSRNFEDIMCLEVTFAVVYLLPALEEIFFSL